MDPYARIVAEDLVSIGRDDVSPTFVCEQLRAMFGTLDHLPRVTFKRETRLAVEVVDIMRAEGLEVPHLW